MNNATTTSRCSIAKGERDRVPGGDYVGSKEGSRNVITVIVGSFLLNLARGSVNHEAYFDQNENFDMLSALSTVHDVAETT